MRETRFHPGDWVVYCKTKHSTHPGPRAENVTPAAFGEQYSYTVDKYWVVDELLSDGRLRLLTRRGKEHVVRPDDPNLHRARWWERLFYRQRFLAIAATKPATR